MRRLACGFGFVALLIWSSWGWTSQAQFWRIEGAQDLLDGTLEGLSMDVQGHLRLGPARRLLHDTEAPDLWCIARDAKGTVYAGTGNDGKVFKWEQGKGSLFFKASELEVHALAVGPDGKLYAGTSPDGKVYAIDSSGKGVSFFEPHERYIWALAFDRQGRLLVATGSDGKLFRVNSAGKGDVLFASSETHLNCLAQDSHGNIYAGSSPGGIVFRIDPSGRAFSLFDSPYREIAAMDVGGDGTLYAAAEDGEQPQRPLFVAPPAASPAPSGAEVIVTEVVNPPAASPAPTRAAEGQRSGARGAILALFPGGGIETLWSSTEEMPHSLVRTPEGLVFGTGNRGKLYRVKDDSTWTMLTSFTSQQVTALSRGAQGELLVGTSNQGRLYAVGPGSETEGTFLSKVKDAEVVAAWGRLRYRAQGRVSVSTRSGNTRNPDSTWGEWSKEYAAAGEPVTSEKSRFVQVKAVLHGESTASPILFSIETGYLQQNLRPKVDSITVHPPGEVIQKPLSISGEPEILGQEPSEGREIRPTPSKTPAPTPLAFARKLYQKGMQTLSWKAEDPNGDPLVYTVEYRAADDDHYHLLRKGLTEPVIVWDTSTVPSGTYVVRVTASDSPGNPEGLALTGQRESAPFDLDTTPPLVTLTLLSRTPLHVRAVVRDEHSVVRKAEYSVDGGKWHEVYPSVGINDGLEETYDIEIRDLSGAGPHTLVVRGTDFFGNVATARVEVK